MRIRLKCEGQRATVLIPFLYMLVLLKGKALESL